MKYRLMLTFVFFSVAACHAQVSDSTKRLSREIFKELVEIDTTDSTGNVTLAAEAAARRLIDAGFPANDVLVLGPTDRKKNVVVRLRGAGKHSPLLLFGHLDVVEARREDWTTNPFEFVEKDGFFYGRGTQDMKDGDAILITTLIRLKEEGYRPDRDIILALTADEEAAGQANGVRWLLKNRPELLDADIALNPDDGGVLTDRGKILMMELDATEKVYADYDLTVTSPGGHSSLPVPDNAIYHLAGGLTRLEHYHFPFELNAVTREYYERMSRMETGQRAADMKAILRNPPDENAIARLSADAIDNAMIHTTCVATRLSGGHANNALPQRAEANVNCRILPGHSPTAVQQELVAILADDKISVRYTRTATPAEKADAISNVPVLRRDMLDPLERVTGEMWPGVPVVPAMSTGASDSIYTNAAGIPSYGVSGVAIDRNDIRAHGKDERVPIESFYRGVDFYYRFVKAMSSEQADSN